MAVDTTIVREAPFLETARQKLLGSADALTQKPVTLPRQQLADFSGATKQAFGAAQSGLGAYQPYLGQAGSAFTKAGMLLVQRDRPLILNHSNYRPQDRFLLRKQRS